MTDIGREKIEEAKKNGQWDSAAGPSPVTEEQIEAVARLLRENEQAHKNFLNMPPSVKKPTQEPILTPKRKPAGPSAWRG